jgi:dTDP-4-dehydrorhamnose reductase
MRLLVIGGSGLVGSHVLREARAGGHHAVGTFHGNPGPGLEALDAADLSGFEALLEKHAPDAVVHAAGWTWVDGCEEDPARAFEENQRQPVRLAQACHRRGIRFVYFSTSYVFDGENAPFDEDAIPAPVNVYARSKWEAERELTEVTGGSVLLPRIICVFGEEARRKNFACQVCDAMTAGKTLRLPSDQSGNPTWAGDIARAVVSLLEKAERGVWHLGGADPECDRVEWARCLVAAFAATGVETHPDFRIVGVPTAELAQRAQRPLRAGIVSRKLARPTFPREIDPEVYRKIAGR